MIDVNVDVYAAQGAAKRFAENNGLRVVFEDNWPGMPRTDGKTIYIPKVRAGMSRGDLQKWWSFLIHETRHCTERGQKAFTFSKEYDVQPMENLDGLLLNLFEDTVVDNIDRGQYRGMDETVSKQKKICMEELIKDKNSAIHETVYSPKSEEQRIVGTSILLDAYVRQGYLPDMVGLVDEVRNGDPPIDAEVARRTEKAIRLCSDDLMKLVEEVEQNDTKDVYEFVRDYLKTVHDMEIPPPKPRPKPKDGEEEGECEGEGEGRPGDKGSREGKEVGDKEGEGKRKELLKAVFEELLDNHDPSFEAKRRVGDIHTDYKESYSRKYKAPNPDEMIVVNHRNKTITDALGNPSTWGTFDQWEYSRTWMEEFYNKEKVRDSLAGDVRRLIQTETRTRVSKNLKKGKLDNTRLYKVGMKGTPADFQKRVFWTHEHKYSVKETIVSLGCDFSGSMSGDKIVTAVHATDLLADVCTSINVNHEVWGFTTLGAYPTHMLFKQFGEKVQRSEIVNRMLQGCNHMENNNDGDNVLLAYQRMRAVPAQRKIMIVLSDGCPAGPRGDIDWWTKQCVDGIVNKGDVELHGIGIMDSSVKRYYPSYSVIRDVRELEAALLEVLKHKLIKQL